MAKKSKSIIWGDPPKFLEFYVPQQIMFYSIFVKKFSKIFEIRSFMSGNFFEEFPRISQKI